MPRGSGFCVRLWPGDLQRLRLCAEWIRDESVQSIAERGILAEVSRLEQQYNGGKPFREREMKG